MVDRSADQSLHKTKREAALRAFGTKVMSPLYLEVFGSAGGTHKVRTWSRGLDCGLLHPAPWPPSRWLVAHPLSPRPLFGRRKRVPMSRGPSAVQAGSVANGSPARLRACRACSWRPRWPRSYQYASRLYQVARFCSDPPPAPPPGSVAKPRTALQAPIGEGGGG